MQCGDNACSTGLPDVHQANGIIRAVPSHGGLHLYLIVTHTPEYALKPPSTGMMVPVTNVEASLQSHCMAPNRSSGSPNRAIGVWSIIWLPLEVRLPSCSVRSCRFCSVRKNPGATAFTRRLGPNFLANSTESHLVRLSTAALAEA